MVVDALGRETPHPIEAASAVRRIGYVSVVLPCLNEEEAVGPTVLDALRGLERAGVDGEVIVVDNGSTDRSVERAQAAGARVIAENRRGYGAAHLAGIRAARGDVVVMADADQTYDLENLGDLLVPLRAGADIVLASRLDGTVERGAMPFLHRYLGTPAINWLLRTLTGTNGSDSQSGYRAFWREVPDELDLRAPGMEYASEMLLKAGRRKMHVAEVPSTYRVRVGEAKLRTFSDGWRHLRMLILMSPHMVLLVPGLLTLLVGLVLCSVSFLTEGGITLFDTRWTPIFIGPLLLVIGAQASFLGALAAYRSPLTPESTRRRLGFLGHHHAVDRILTMFLAIALVGVAIDAALFALWIVDRSGDSLLGVAGVAQALILVGVNGIMTLFAADYSRESLGW